MSLPLRVALLGFKANERAAIEAFLRLAPKRVPAYAQAPTPEAAELLLVDTDDPVQCVRAVELRGTALRVAVGGETLRGAALHVPRLLNVLQLFASIDRLRHPLRPETAALEAPPPAPRAQAAAAPAAPPGQAQVETAADARLEPMPPSMPEPMPMPMPMPATMFEAMPEPSPAILPETAAAATAAPTPPPGPPGTQPSVPLRRRSNASKGRRPALASDLALPMMPAHERITLVGLDDDPPPPQAARPGRPADPASASHTAARLKHVLVVGADEELFRTLVAWIEPFGFAVHRAADAADAADRAGERRFDHALVRASAEADGGAPLAATLRRAARDRSLTPPRVALFGPPQALSAALAGSTAESSEVDAVLQLPLRHKDLLELLGGHMLRRQDFSPTLPQTDFA